MSASRSGSSGNVLVALLAAGLIVSAARAEDKAELPQATVPLPSPEPPQRPPELISPPPAMPMPSAEAPLPPDRPSELADRNAPVTLPDAASATAPLPPERPADLASGNAAVTTPDGASARAPLPEPPPRPLELSASVPLSLTIPSSDAPLPPERPPEFANAPAAKADPAEAKASGPLSDVPMPPARPPEMSGETAQSLALAVPEDTACLRNLESLGVRFEKLPPIVNGQCTVAHPLNVVTLSEGVGMNSIAVTADQMVVCGVAEGLGRWAKDAQTAAEKELGERLKGLTLGGGYHCRGQNNVGEAKLSEHAFANAMDIMGFTFAKHAPILVGFLPEDSAEAKFLDSVRASACKYFRTVLGPGSNEAHANHLHFDQRERSGGYRICELGAPQATAAASGSTHADR